MISKKNKREEENMYTKLERGRKTGVSQVGVGAWVSFFYLSKCHFGEADLSGFSIRELSGFAVTGCGFSRPCIFIFPLSFRGHFAFSFHAFRTNSVSVGNPR